VGDDYAYAPTITFAMRLNLTNGREKPSDVNPQEESNMASSKSSNIMQSIDVNVPVRTAYNQWTQFEEFPMFMQGVESVEQLDDETLRWKAEIGGKTKEWTARITEQTPDKRIAWTSTDEHERRKERRRRHLPPHRRQSVPRSAPARL
jgi:uncharacterized membrane protein